MPPQPDIEADRQNRARHRGLSAEGRERLRQAALRNRPWEHSTGPRTAEGKRRSRMNALRTGRYTAERRAWRRDANRFLRLNRKLREVILGPLELERPHALVAELTVFAERIT